MSQGSVLTSPMISLKWTLVYTTRSTSPKSESLRIKVRGWAARKRTQWPESQNLNIRIAVCKKPILDYTAVILNTKMIAVNHLHTLAWIELPKLGLHHGSCRRFIFGNLPDFRSNFRSSLPKLHQLILEIDIFRGHSKGTQNQSYRKRQGGGVIDGIPAGLSKVKSQKSRHIHLT